MNNQQSIRRWILEALENADPYTLAEETLRVELVGLSRGALNTDGFREAMEWLRSKHYIASIPDELDPDVHKWLISSSGKALLLK